MRRRRLATVVAALAVLGSAVACSSTQPPPPGAPAAPSAGSTAWGGELDAVIDAAKPGDYATFDADNTLWQHDLTEALLAKLDNQHVLSFDTLDPAEKLIPVNPGESLYGYYLRLCDSAGDDACYLWIAGAFSNIPLSDLKRHVDALMADPSPIPVSYVDDGKPVHETVSPPKIFAEQIKLLNRLRDKGIRTYVVSAANEEIARMVLTDPKYGLNFAQDDVFGVNLLLRDPTDGSITTSRRQIEAGHYLDAEYPPARHARHVITPTLSNPGTWYIGKQTAIQRYIAPYRRPVIAAGDAKSDWFMLFYVNAQTPTSGMRLWVDKDSPGVGALTDEQHSRVTAQTDAGQPVDADRGWITRTPEKLGPR